jgi:gamma-glutamylcysteine synthetase
MILVIGHALAKPDTLQAMPARLQGMRRGIEKESLRAHRTARWR